MKELEGKDVYLLPTGNNARIRGKSEPIKATITKVARVFVYFRIGDRGREEKYRYDKNDYHIRSDYNSGYMVFKDKQAFEDFTKRNKLAALIWSRFSYSGAWRQIDLCVLEKIAELLNIKEG